MPSPIPLGARDRPCAITHERSCRIGTVTDVEATATEDGAVYRNPLIPAVNGNRLAVRAAAVGRLPAIGTAIAQGRYLNDVRANADRGPAWSADPRQRLRRRQGVDGRRRRRSGLAHQAPAQAQPTITHAAQSAFIDGLAFCSLVAAAAAAIGAVVALKFLPARGRSDPPFPASGSRAGQWRR